MTSFEQTEHLANIAPQAVTTQEENTWAMVCHLSALSGYFIPFGNLLGPLIVWIIKKDASQNLDQVGKQALNFHLSYTIYLTAALTVFAVSLVVPFIGWLFAFVVALPVAVILGLIELVYSIVAAVNAYQGKPTAYPPMTLQLLK